MIECQGLRKSFGPVAALRDLTFSAGPGCTGFLGPNGAGKTTAIRILAGLSRPDGGSVRVAGLDAVQRSAEVRRRVGYLAQSPAFYNYMTGMEFLVWVATIFHLPRPAARARAEELLRRFGLWEARGRTIGGYSGGMRQRLGIAQALVHRPEVVFLDEPVSALDPLGRHEVLALIDELKAETTVFMSSHVLGDVQRVADAVVIVRDGRVAVQAGMRELLRDQVAADYEVEVAPGDPDLTSMLQSQPWAATVRSDGPRYRVTPRDSAAAQRALPRAVLDAGATLVRYGAVTPTLEDVFMKIVGTEAVASAPAAPPAVRGDAR